MPINPIQFANQICEDFKRYLFSSAFPLADPELADPVKRRFEGSTALTSPSFRAPTYRCRKRSPRGSP